MTDDSIVLSIIIPVYNGADYIADSLNSVLLAAINISYEIIVVDDGSNDNTCDIVENFNDYRIRLICQNNAGPSAARNKGLENALGQHIMFLDSDDSVNVDVFNLMLSLLPTNKTLLFNHVDVYYDKQICESSSLFANKHIRREEVLEKLLVSSCVNHVWGKVYCREIIEKNSIRFRQDIVLGEDLIFNITYFENDDTDIDYYDLPLIRYNRTNENSVVTKYYSRYFMDLQKNYECRLSCMTRFFDSNKQMKNQMKNQMDKLYFTRYSKMVFDAVEHEKTSALDIVVKSPYINDWFRWRVFLQFPVRYILVKYRMYKFIHFINKKLR